MAPTKPADDTNQLWDRMREAETKIAVHEAICAWRYKVILWALGANLTGTSILLLGAVVGNPFVVWLQGLGGAH